MLTLDVFDGDAFRVQDMIQALDRVPYLPSWLGSLEIFTPEPIITDVAQIEKRDTTLSLIKTTPRYSPAPQGVKDPRNLRAFSTLRLKKEDVMNAGEIANVRAFGEATELETLQAEILRRQTKLRNDMEYTLEYHRLGAVQGVLLDSDGSVLYDWFDQWGITQSAEIDFDLDNATPASGVLRKKCNAVIREMKRAAKGAWIPGRTQVYGICGDAFWDDLTAHVEVRTTYLNWSAAADLREGNAFGMFQFGSIVWVNYQGSDDGSEIAVGTDKVKFFPVGAPGVFQQVQSPGESFDEVNTLGQPFYPRTIPDRDRNEKVTIELASYPLHICTHPAMLLRGKRT
jgi:hypothetical protein